MPSGNEKPQEVVDIKNCLIESVVVYSDRAEVKRKVPVTLPPGESEVLFKRLSESVDGDSIRVEGEGSAIILDVVHYSSFENMAEVKTEMEPGEYEAVVSSLKDKKDKVKLLSIEVETLERKRVLLRTYAQNACHLHTQGDEDVRSLPDMVKTSAVNKVAEFLNCYQAQLVSVDETLAARKDAVDELNDEIRVLQAKAAELNPAKKTTVEQQKVLMLKVSLKATQETEVTLRVSYVVSNASWSPSYDLRVLSSNKSMKLYYYGKIKQSTGEDWENAPLSLSTAVPSVGGSPPCLGIHYIQFRRRPVYYDGDQEPRRHRVSGFSYEMDRMDNALFGIRGSIEDSLSSCSVAEDDWSDSCSSSVEEFASMKPATKQKKKKEKKQKLAEEALEVVETQVDSAHLYNAVYEIPCKSTIPADNTEHKVTVTTIDLKPDFSYVSVPRLSPHTFLKATVKNSSTYTILSGPANVFFDNNFLAKSKVDSTSPNEEFTCSLGVDQSLRITCHPVSVVTGTTGRLTKSSLLTYTHKFSVKNTQSGDAQLKISEQVPLSTDERMKVVVTSPDVKKKLVKVPFSSGYVILNDSNNLEWHCTIPGGTTLDLKLVYTIEYPLNDTVEGLPST